MFYPRDPYEIGQKNFQSRIPLSIAQIISQQSIDAETVALLWLMIEHGTSLTVAGPTEPKPATGKTTTLQALLQFLRERVALIYVSGMHETFAFTRLPDLDPTNTYVLCSEVSDHNATYMWGSRARRYLMLPAQGYHIATSVHADTINDVLHLYQHDLRMRIEDIHRLGLVVNIGLIGHGKSLRRRWISTYFLQPEIDPKHPETILKLPLSFWNEADGTFEHADLSVLDQLAAWAKLTPLAFTVSLKQRTECLKELAQGQGATMEEVYEAIRTFRRQSNELSLTH